MQKHIYCTDHTCGSFRDCKYDCLARGKDMDNKIDLVAIKEERDLMLRTGLSIADKFINKNWIIEIK